MAQSSLAPLAFADGAAGPSTAPSAHSEPVDVNRATADVLRKSVPKVGAVLAQRIVEFRDQNGPFKSIDDLMTVPGIGRRLAESLMPPPPETSLIMPIRNDTLPPPWGAPSGGALLLGGVDEGQAPKDEKVAANDGAPAPTTDAPPGATSASKSAPATAPATPSRLSAYKLAGLSVAVVAGLCIGIWANTESVKRPTRELSERIEVNRTETEHTRTEIEQQRGELLKTQDEVKALQARVDAESAERKADQAKVARDVSTLHDTVKKTTQSNEARIQRLRETLTEIELYHGANISHPGGKGH
jgi:competence ComEA-like helix-hairpin-helix protein